MLRAKSLVALGLACGGIGLLASCALPPNGGLTQTRADATPYPEAHSRCNERGMGAPAGGQGESATRERIYRACMAEMGWEDRRTF